MKKSKRQIRLGVGIVIVVLIGLLIGWQRNNLKAIQYALWYTPQQAKQLEQENEKEIQTLSERVSEVDFSRLPPEARELLEKGELSEEEAVAVLTGELSWETLKELRETGEPGGQKIQSQLYSGDSVDSIIAQIYVLRSGYTGKLDALVQQAKAEYISKKATKAELSSKYMGLGTALEGECDEKMSVLLSKLRTAMEREGRDTSLISEIQAAYQREKSLKKASLISKYKE